MPGPMARLTIKVVPGSSRDLVAGWLGDALRVRVTAPAEKGRANRAVEKLLARTLEVPATAVKVISGKTSPRKIVEIAGLTDAALRKRLG